MNIKEHHLSSLSTDRLYTSMELEAKGLNRMSIKRYGESGDLVLYTRGIYMLKDTSYETGLDLAVISKLRDGVVCLRSAAAFHEIGDENPMDISYAVDRETFRKPSISSFNRDHTLYYWSGDDLSIGVDTIQVLGQNVRITNMARTVVDLCRFRSKVGEEIAVRAFSDFLKSGGDMNEVWETARLIGVAEGLTPFFQMADELQESLQQRRI